MPTNVFSTEEVESLLKEKTTDLDEEIIELNKQINSVNKQMAKLMGENKRLGSTVNVLTGQVSNLTTQLKIVNTNQLEQSKQIRDLYEMNDLEPDDEEIDEVISPIGRRKSWHNQATLLRPKTWHNEIRGERRKNNSSLSDHDIDQLKTEVQKIKEEIAETAKSSNLTLLRQQLTSQIGDKADLETLQNLRQVDAEELMTIRETIQSLQSQLDTRIENLSSTLDAQSQELQNKMEKEPLVDMYLLEKVRGIDCYCVCLADELKILTKKKVWKKKRLLCRAFVAAAE